MDIAVHAAVVVIAGAVAAATSLDQAGTPAAASRPQGTIAYLAGTASESWITTLDVAGGTKERLAPTLSGGNPYPALSLSPDGRSLAFTGVAPQGARPGLFVARTKKGGLERWRTFDIAEARGIEELAWSRNGREIAFDRGPRRPSDDCSDPSADLRIDVTGRAGTRVLNAYPALPTSGTLDNIRWAPGDRKLLYLVRHWVLGRGEECDWGEVELLTIRADGRGRRVMTRGDSISDAEWSPDGKWIAYGEYTERDDYLVKDLFLLSADGSKKRRIAKDITSFGWAPDGRRILLVEPGLVKSLDVTSRQVRVLARWQPIPDASGFNSAFVYATSSRWAAVPAGGRYNASYDQVWIRIGFVPLSGGAPRFMTLEPPRGDAWLGSTAVNLR